MISTTRSSSALRRSLYTVFAACAAGGASVAALMGNPAPSATAATDPCAASELARTIGSVATSTGAYLDSHPANQPGADHHLAAAGRPAVAGGGEVVLRREPPSRQGHAAVAAAAGQPVYPLQAADQPASADGAHAGCAAAGRRSARWFAGRPADGADDRRSRSGAARFAVTCSCSHAGHRTASRTVDRHQPIAPGDARRGPYRLLSCGFRLSYDWLTARQESRHPFCLAFSCRNRQWLRLSTSDEGACPCCSRPVPRGVR